MFNIQSLKAKINRYQAKRKLKKGKGPFRSKRRVAQTSKKNINLLPKLKKPLIVLLILAIFLPTTGLSGFVLKQYFSLNIDNETTWDGESKQNILILGLDKKEYGYIFVDMLTILMIDPVNDDLGIFSIDPDIAFKMSDGSEATLRRAYNITIEGKTGTDNVIYGVEQIIATEIDKYVALDQAGFHAMNGFFGKFEADVPVEFIETDYKELEEPLEVDDGSHKFGTDKILGVMAADEMGIDNKLSVQTSVLRNYSNNIGSAENFLRLAMNLAKLKELDTNFSKREMIRLYYFLNKLNSSDIRLGFTRQSSLLAGDVPSGQGKTPLYENIDKDVQSIFLDTSITKERAQLEVLNATDTANLATRYSRFFSNSGIRVVRTGNALRQTSETTLYVQNPSKYPYTIEQISTVFDGNLKIIEQEYKYKHIGELVLVIGQNGV